MEEETAKNFFTWLDYSLFFGMLTLSALIGAYFGFFGKKQDSPKEYLHGGKNMNILPVAASLVASDISGVTLLASPADVYMNGSAYSMVLLATIIMSIVIIYVFLPVFYTLQVTSSFEYLQLRFSKRVCVMASFIFAFISIMFLPVVIYIPALAFNQVSGVNINLIIPIVCIICIFYTTIGGIKAVVWTDTLQMLIMVGSILVVFFLGVRVEGGFANVWAKATEGGRVSFNFRGDPTDKQDFITVFFGFTILLVGIGSNPIFTQRFLAVPTKTDAKITAILFCIGSVFFKALSWFLGLIIYAHYAGCSPLAAGYIKKPDQILPYYIMEVSSTLPGLPGIFIAGLFCAALSSISSGLNTMAGTIYEDFVKPHLPEETTDKRASDIMKLIVVILGMIFLAMVFVVQYLGALLQLSIILGGIVVGPILALFALGMLVPHINEKGIFYGCIAGLLFVAWIVTGAVYYKLTGQIKEEYLPFSVETCEALKNVTVPLISAVTQDVPVEQPFYLYRISYYYYAFFGFLATTVVALPVSLLTGGYHQVVHKDFLSPIIHPLLRKQPKKPDDDMQNPKDLEHLSMKEPKEQTQQTNLPVLTNGVQKEEK